MTELNLEQSLHIADIQEELDARLASGHKREDILKYIKIDCVLCDLGEGEKRDLIDYWDSKNEGGRA